MSEIIELTETARLLIEQATDAENPRKDMDMATGFVKIEGRGDSRLMDVEPVHEAPIPIRDAHERIHRSVACAPNCPWGSRHQVHVDEQDVIRWARIFHGLHIEYDSEHGGYWFVAPEQIKVNNEHGGDWSSLEKQAEVIASERETYRQWADGEVYTVILERAASYARVEFNERDEVWNLVSPLTEDDIQQEWVEVEAISGCYLDDKYTAQVVADEYWDLTPEEYVALGLPGSPLSGLALHTIDDIRAAEEDVPLIDEAAGRLTPAGELYLRLYQVHEDEPRETPAEATTGVSGEW